MLEPIQLSITPDDALRVLQAVEFYIQSWRDTTICLTHGHIPDDAAIHSNCDDPKVAERQFKQFKGLHRRLNDELDKVHSTKKVTLGKPVPFSFDPRLL